MATNDSSKAMRIPFSRKLSYNGDTHSMSSTPDPYYVNSESASIFEVDFGEASKATSDTDFSDAERGFDNALAEADKKLEEVVGDEGLRSEETHSIITQPDPYQDWTCAFGFTGKLEELAAAPTTKRGFLQALEAEIRGIGFIQNGLKSYITAINSGYYHVFSAAFLEHQNTAFDKNSSQLNQINLHLKEVIREVKAIDGDTVEVKPELVAAYKHARPWVQRSRKILVESHVFYKINYVLGSDKHKHD